MALITQFEHVRKEGAKIHDPVTGGYCSFLGKDNKRYFILETYGTEQREFPDKVSQSLQLDESGAAELIRILRSEFPNLQ